MSDYLWNKTGEPDAEAERLETLLGAFAHTPRPLELPAGAAAQEPRASARLPRLFAVAQRAGVPARFAASRFFAPATAACAALLLLAFVFAASAFLRARVAHEERRAASSDSPRRQNELQKQGGEQNGVASATQEPARHAPETATHGGGAKVEAGLVKDESVAVENLSNGSRQRRDLQLASLNKRRQRLAPVAPVGEGEGFTIEAMRARGAASSLVESTRLETKEQLIYALRLTGAKLRDVRLKAGQRN